MANDCANGFWSTIDRWGPRLLMIAAVLALLTTSVVAWANMEARLCALERRVDAIERLVEEQIRPMRDDVLVIKRDVADLRAEAGH